MSSSEYWRKRESEALKARLKDEAAYQNEIETILKNMRDAVQKEIDSFYAKYANSEGITLAEAKKRISKADIEAYARKAEKYVKERDFSKRANEEMRLYNATMKINRLELLKANIGLELLSGTDEIEKLLNDALYQRTMDEYTRQAGILGKTIVNNAKKAKTIVEASFHNATFSERIWNDQALLRAEIDKLLQTGLIQGKNPRVLARDLKKVFNTTTANAERLMRTELARVQIAAQKDSLVANGFKKYTFIVNTGCCPVCAALNDKHFDVAKMMPGTNAPPIHPNCVLPDTNIIAPDLEAMTKSEYSGNVVEIRTANGTRLSVTANHIMLTARGWVRAKNIVKGDKVIHYSGWAESVIESNPANSDCIPDVEELFASLVKSGPMSTMSVPVSAEDFKGDVVPNSKVDVVFINGELRDKLDSTARKLVSDVLLIGASERNERGLSGNCSLAKFLVGAGLVADGIMSGTDVAGILLGSSFTHHELVSFRRPSDYDARLFKTAIDNGTADTKLFRNGVLADSRGVHVNDTANVDFDSNASKINTAPSETPFDRAFVDAVNIRDLLSAFSGFVSFDDVTFVSNKFYSGHVYDASSLSTLYIANGILSSNCRCSVAAYDDDDEYEAWLDYLDNGGTTAEWNAHGKAKWIANKKHK